MPKNRPPTKNQTKHCSFCGAHKDTVPLMVTSSLHPTHAICSTCGLGVVEQVQRWAYGVFQTALDNEIKSKSRLKGVEGV